ncbi:MAG: flagellar motor switch protein FliG [Planctomycetota bacterium]|jgi:flagellar motor switch protein FliG
MSDTRSGITGPQKVAAFLLALDKETSSKVMRGLDPKVVADVAEAMTELDPEICSAEAVDGLFVELARTIFQRTGVRPQDKFELHDMLKTTFGEDEAERVLADIIDRRRKEQPFSFIERVPSQNVVRVLADESPPVVALVLSHLSPNLSSEVLTAFTPDESLDIVRRMTTIVPPGTDTMLAIADGLMERLSRISSGPPPRARDDSLKTVADLLNFSGGETEKVVMEGLEKNDEEVAAEVRDFMFTWDDLGSIDKRAMQKILASVDTRTLAMSLKASPPLVEANIMDNLSQRVREMVLDERELAGSVPISEVHAARGEIMIAVRGLMEAGEFSPSKSGGEMVT